MMRSVIWYILILNTFVSPVGVWAAFHYSKAVDVRLIEYVESPTGNIAVSLLREGDLLDNAADSWPPRFSLYAHERKMPPPHRFRPLLRALGFEPAPLVARGEYWKTGATLGGPVARWTGPDHLVFRFCGGTIFHYTNRVEVELKDGGTAVIHVDIHYDDCPTETETATPPAGG